MLLAGHGDCLWIEYGDPKAPRRVLIDGGATGTYKRALRERLRGLPAERDVSSCWWSRISTPTTSRESSNCWRTARRASRPRTSGSTAIGISRTSNPRPSVPVQGERLTDLLVKPGVTWNGEFKRAAVVVPADGEAAAVELDGGLVLTLLSPTPGKLADLKPDWEKEVRKAGLDPNQPRPGEVESPEGFDLLGSPDVDALATEAFSEDTAKANGSSIAMLAEFEGRRLLLTGDAHPGIMTAAIKRLAGGGRLAVDACKLPHHGSKANVNRQFLQALDCKKWLFSTNGAHFKHPDRQAVARVIKWGGAQPELSFNYRTKYNDVWDGKPLREQYGYKVSYPASDAEGIVLEWH